jgi:hypothetical protein
MHILVFAPLRDISSELWAECKKPNDQIGAQCWTVTLNGERNGDDFRRSLRSDFSKDRAISAGLSFLKTPFSRSRALLFSVTSVRLFPFRRGTARTLRLRVRQTQGEVSAEGVF